MACQYEGGSSPRSQPPARNSRANAPTAGSVSLLAESAERFSNEKITLIEVYENASIIVLVGHRVRKGTRVLLKVNVLRYLMRASLRRKYRAGCLTCVESCHAASIHTPTFCVHARSASAGRSSPPRRGCTAACARGRRR
eukprot:6206860-Pleurochrysis_carterae.AAC.4